MNSDVIGNFFQAGKRKSEGKRVIKPKRNSLEKEKSRRRKQFESEKEKKDE